jgi:short-subunit dehydrogenase involved in D-alanine esterification of teichoic acids
MQLIDKTVLLTGGSQGIGLETARVLAASGARVMVCSRSRHSLPTTVEFLPCDLSDAAARQALPEQVRARTAGIDVLINNAGQQLLVDFRGPVAWERVRSELELNLVAALHLTALFLPGMLRRPEAALVNVTSGLALVPKRSAPSYCAAKAALRSFSQALRYQLEGTSVRVVEALPPLVDTEMTRGRGKNKLSAAAVAEQLVAGLQSGRSEIRIGKTRALFALHRVSPALAARLLRDA